MFTYIKNTLIYIILNSNIRQVHRRMEFYTMNPALLDTPLSITNIQT